MGKARHHRRIWHATRRIVALTSAFALILAPLVVILTHGPAAYAAAASIETPIAAHHHSHGHDHGHVHEETKHDHHGGLFAGHNPTDHDHQLHALICQPVTTAKPYPDKACGGFSNVFRQLTPEGLIPPPRSF